MRRQTNNFNENFKLIRLSPYLVWTRFRDREIQKSRSRKQKVNPFTHADRQTTKIGNGPFDLKFRMGKVFGPWNPKMMVRIHENEIFNVILAFKQYKQRKNLKIIRSTPYLARANFLDCGIREYDGPDGPMKMKASLFIYKKR